MRITRLFRLFLSSCRGGMAYVGILLLTWPVLAIQIQVNPPVPRPGSVIRLEVTGTWPSRCVPVMDHATIHNGRFRIYAKTEGLDCPPEPTPFHLETLLGHWMYSLTAASGFYPVEFYVQTHPENPPHLYAFNVIRADRNPAVRLLPENGFWWVDERGLYGQAGRGSGISIDRQGDKMIVTVQSYNSQGQPVWYFAEGALAHGVFRADYHQIAGGSPLYAVGNSPRQVQKAGHMILTFDNQRQGTLWLAPDLTHLPEQGLAVFPVSIKRYVTAASLPTEALSGRWVLVGGNSQGSELVLVSAQSSRKAAASGTSLEFDVSNGRRLRCRLGVDKNPVQCLLLEKDDTELALFDDVGVDRLRGVWLASGQTLSLMRVE